MSRGREPFSLVGPKYLTTIDWTDDSHRRSVSASLVKGVSERERDRLVELRGGSETLAPQWWEFFNFKLVNELVNEDDQSIFGAIFEYVLPSANNPGPGYVIAFRGTLFKRETWKCDLESNFAIMLNTLHQKSHVRTAMKYVEDRVSKAGSSKVWLTGHSLGAAIAMLAGKHMAKRGKFLESFLFNPPYASFPIETIFKDNKNVIRGLQLIKGGVAHALGYSGGDEDSFAAISGWKPCLFVNSRDFICHGYIEHFKHRRKSDDVGVWGLISHHSLRNIVMKKLKIMDVEISEPLHLLPSAKLIENLSPPEESISPHKLRHWWKPDLNLLCTVYNYE
ncbi:GDSL esterase/lipase [Gossypium australe]|uniref:GDSL esterase/lipase n=1 Tax=Gossypium australe TaxID=47621 RepID=A0A5B6VHX9_9ROSI|nr:GDSL esterase/lipase [Gossypium australe]